MGIYANFAGGRKLKNSVKKPRCAKSGRHLIPDAGPILKVRDHFEVFPRERVEERLALRVEAEDAAVGFSSRFPIQQPVSLEKLP